MEAERFARLVEIMERLKVGDGAAVFVLYEEFGGTLAARLRRELARVGVEGVARDDLDGLVMEACLELRDVARGWDPEGGALPWTWAWRHIRKVVGRFVGQHADPLDGAEELRPADPVAAGGPEAEDAGRLLDHMGERGPMCRLLRDALGEVASERDRLIFLEVKLQASLGDPSPAATVGAELGMRAEAVRQVVSRVRRRLRALADGDDRYRPLADLAILR